MAPLNPANWTFQCIRAALLQVLVSHFRLPTREIQIASALLIQRLQASPIASSWISSGFPTSWTWIRIYTSIILTFLASFRGAQLRPVHSLTLLCYSHSLQSLSTAPCVARLSFLPFFQLSCKVALRCRGPKVSLLPIIADNKKSIPG